MRKLLSIIAILCFIGICSIAQRSSVPVKFKIKNSSLVPKNISIIYYQPGTKGHGTKQVKIMPGAEKALAFREGTKVFLANESQLDSVMNGKRIDKEEPFMIVKKEQNGKTFLF